MSTVRASLPIRCSTADAYRSFVEPDRLTKFWLRAASAPLEVGCAVQWDFMVAGASAQTTATALDPGRSIDAAWDDGTLVRWRFEPQGDGSTLVSVEQTGVAADDALDATEGFTIVLCDLKVWLETGTSPNLVRDKAALIERLRTG
jgi:hypothetical protein